MGNKITSEQETLITKLEDIDFNIDLCVWEARDDENLYDIHGSRKTAIIQYATVHKLSDTVITKWKCNKVKLNSSSFTNVRKSVITRNYDSGTKNEDTIIIGDNNGSSYNITNMIK